MVIKKILHIFFFSVVIVISGCSSGGDDSGGNNDSGQQKPNLTGDYFGTFRDSAGDHTISVSISGDRINSVFVDDSDLGINGTIINSTTPNFYSSILSDDTEVGFTKTTSANHLGFVLEDFGFAGQIGFGILTKNASGLPTFSNRDYGGEWLGVEVELSMDFDLEGVRDFAATTIAATYRGGGFEQFSGSFSNDVSNYGIREGAFNSETVNNGLVTVFMSADKAASAFYACSGPNPSFDTCTLALVSNTYSRPQLGLISVDVDDAASVRSQFQLHLNGDLPASNTAIDCAVTAPIHSNDVSCVSANFLSGTSTIDMELLFDNTTSATLHLNVANLNDMSGSTLTIGNTNYNVAAQKAYTRLVTRNQVDHAAQEYTVIVLLNPLPQFSRASLLSVSGQSMPTGMLWDQDYEALYNSYTLTPTAGLVPQSTSAYRNANTRGSGRLATDIVSAVLSADPNNTSATARFNSKYYTDNPRALFLQNGLPPSRGQISVDGVSASGTNFNNPINVGAAIDTISWADNTANSSSVRWQVLLMEVDPMGDGSGSIKHTQVRTARMPNGNNGLQLTGNQWDWSATPEFVIQQGNKYKLQLRASNSSNTTRGLSQSVFLEF